MTNTEINNNNIAIEAEIEVIENNTPEQQNTEETYDEQTCCTFLRINVIIVVMIQIGIVLVVMINLLIVITNY